MGDFIYKGLLSIIGGCFVIIAFFTRSAVDEIRADVKKNKDDLQNHEKEMTAKIAAHELHVSEVYSKDANIQQSIARIHLQMENGFDELKDELKEDRASTKEYFHELREDIKNLIRGEAV